MSLLCFGVIMELCVLSFILYYMYIFIMCIEGSLNIEIYKLNRYFTILVYTKICGILRFHPVK